LRNEYVVSCEKISFIDYYLVKLWTIPIIVG
jgi:hypothetical protein